MTPVVRKLIIALAVSVALNLFGLGFLVARGMHRPHGPPGMGPDAGAEFGGARMHGGMRGLGPHAAQLMDQHRDAMREQHRAVADAHRAVAAALTAEPFDRAALETTLTALRARQAQAAQAAHASLVELAVKLDAPGRRALAERGPGMRMR